MRRISKYHRITQHWWPAPFRPRPSDWQLVTDIRHAFAQLDRVSNCQLADQRRALQDKVRGGTLLLDHDIVIPCFALTMEAMRRVTGLILYDVQLLAGLVLATGAIAEMKTGEGKTVVAALPAVLHSLGGEGVHVATVNSYLAERDWAELSPVYELLTLTVGLLAEGASPEEKQLAYDCDITYGTGYEFGFDYLRDQAAGRSQRKLLLGERFRSRLRGHRADQDHRRMQRRHAFAVVDEVDSVLIDEANTPLVLSSLADGDASAQERVFTLAARLARQLVEGQHYLIDRRQRSVVLTEDGQRFVYDGGHVLPREGLVRPWSVYVTQALQAQLLFRKDVDYVVQEDVVRIVDTYTGRIFTDRTWRDGLHQAVEVKERVTVTPEKQSIARISRQRYFGLYRGLCGMTGTATGHEAEFKESYGLPVVVIPERLPSQRKRYPTRYFGELQHKWQAVADDVTRRFHAGQPVLVGTSTITESQAIADCLYQRGIPHRVLNGTQDENEAEIIARAGERQAVTIATNMAGRGTDIKLADGVAALGGLHVIATQRQESQRVDRQLIGRAARQGQPGSYQIFVAAADDLLASFGLGVASKIAQACGESTEAYADFDADLDTVQQLAERRRADQRAQLYRHDQWLNDVLTTVAEQDSVPDPVVS